VPGKRSISLHSAVDRGFFLDQSYQSGEISLCTHLTFSIAVRIGKLAR